MSRKQTKAILIVGGSGFIGTHLALRLRQNYKVFSTFYRHQLPIEGVTQFPMDANDRDWVKRVMYLIQPKVIIYATGRNDVEWAEANNNEAGRVHVDGAVNISTASQIFQPKFIYISNNYVYDGKHGNYSETDTTVPPSFLGKIKINGENSIKGRSLNFVFVRSAPVYGRSNFHNLSFLDKLRLRLSLKEKIELPTNEFHNFAPINGLVDLVCALVEGGPRNQPIHYGGLTRTNVLEFGKAFAKYYGYDSNLIIEKKAPELRGISIAPTYDYSLNVTQLAKVLNFKPLLLEEGFDLFQKQLIT